MVFPINANDDARNALKQNMRKSQKESMFRSYLCPPAILLRLGGGVLILASVLVSRYSAECQSLIPVPLRNSGRHLDQIAAGRQAASTGVAGLFAPSLDTMERTEFLLTPPMIMQQSISDGVVISYP
jgi:hypothetical protein